MQCPKCKTETMTKQTVEGVELEKCSTCNGILLDKGELRDLLQKQAALHVDDKGHAEDHMITDVLHVKCPVCDEEMTSSTLEGTNVDLCQKCGRAFLDQGELAALQEKVS